MGIFDLHEWRSLWNLNKPPKEHPSLRRGNHMYSSFARLNLSGDPASIGPRRRRYLITKADGFSGQGSDEPGSSLAASYHSSPAYAHRHQQFANDVYYGNRRADSLPRNPRRSVSRTLDRRDALPYQVQPHGGHELVDGTTLPRNYGNANSDLGGNVGELGGAGITAGHHYVNGMVERGDYRSAADMTTATSASDVESSMLSSYRRWDNPMVEPASPGGYNKPGARLLGTAVDGSVSHLGHLPFTDRNDRRNVWDHYGYPTSHIQQQRQQQQQQQQEAQEPHQYQAQQQQQPQQLLQSPQQYHQQQQQQEPSFQWHNQNSQRLFPQQSQTSKDDERVENKLPATTEATLASSRSFTPFPSTTDRLPRTTANGTTVIGRRQPVWVALRQQRELQEQQQQQQQQQHQQQQQQSKVAQLIAQHEPARGGDSGTTTRGWTTKSVVRPTKDVEPRVTGRVASSQAGVRSDTSTGDVADAAAGRPPAQSVGGDRSPGDNEGSVQSGFDSALKKFQKLIVGYDQRTSAAEEEADRRRQLAARAQRLGGVGRPTAGSGASAAGDGGAGNVGSSGLQSGYRQLHARSEENVADRVVVSEQYKSAGDGLDRRDEPPTPPRAVPATEAGGGRMRGVEIQKRESLYKRANSSGLPDSDDGMGCRSWSSPTAARRPTWAGNESRAPLQSPTSSPDPVERRMPPSNLALLRQDGSLPTCAGTAGRRRDFAKASGSRPAGSADGGYSTDDTLP